MTQCANVSTEPQVEVHELEGLGAAVGFPCDKLKIITTNLLCRVGY